MTKALSQRTSLELHISFHSLMFVEDCIMKKLLFLGPSCIAVMGINFDIQHFLFSESLGHLYQAGHAEANKYGVEALHSLQQLYTYVQCSE